MTPEEFAKEMREIYPENGVYDTEVAHIAADQLMEDALIDLGYGEGIAISHDVDRYYS